MSGSCAYRAGPLAGPSAGLLQRLDTVVRYRGSFLGQTVPVCLVDFSLRAREGRRACCSPPASVSDPAAKPVEVARIGRRRRRRGRAFEKQATQVMSVPVLLDQFADIFARCAVSALSCLIGDEVP